MREYQKGQVLLILILVMVVALTVGLSIATQTITHLRTANEEESSERAFAAAEAGIERAMVSNVTTNGSFSNSSSYQTVVQSLSGTEFLLNNGQVVSKDEPVDLWLSTYPTYASPRTGNVTIYWGMSSDVCANAEANNTLPALSITLLTGTSANPRMSQYALEPCGPRRTNNFEAVNPAGGTISGKTFIYRRTISITSGLLMRIIPLYAPGIIGVRGCDGANTNCSVLPTQGTVIESTGISDKTQRKIVSFRGYPKLPVELFPYVLFSPK